MVDTIVSNIHHALHSDLEEQGSGGLLYGDFDAGSRYELKTYSFYRVKM